MKMMRILMVAAAAALIASPVMAADSSAAPAKADTAMAKPAPKMEGREAWGLMDSNGDGQISKDEWMAAQQKKFEDIDTNHDGNISKDEWMAHGKAMHAAHGHHMAKGSTSTPPAGNEAASAPPPSTPAGADGAGGSTAQ